MVKGKKNTLATKIAALEQSYKDLEAGLSEQLHYSRGFYDGRQYIVRTAEKILSNNIGCQNRQELVESGKLPAFWIATLVECLTNPPNVYNFPREQQKEIDNEERE